MKRLSWMIMGIILVLSVLASIVSAKPFGKERRPDPFKNLEILRKKIELTDAQMEKLKAKRDENLKKRVELSDKIQVEKMKMRELMEAKKPENEKIMATADKLHQLKGEKMKMELESKLFFRSQLTDEQFKKLTEDFPPPKRKFPSKPPPPERNFREN